MKPVFTGSLTRPEPIPEAGVARALELLRSGYLFRYGEWGGGLSEVSLLEEELARYLGVPYACATNSGGGALFLALKAVGVEPGDRVLTNAFTLAPVPGAVAHAAAEPVFVDITEDFVIDLADLREKAAASGARTLLLSYMRGHVPDLDALTRTCRELGLTLIEDCAHTLGATWRGQHLGTFGVAGCYSAQTFKHINSGEGGFLATRDEVVAARAVLMSGSYMLYEQNGARPAAAVFERFRDGTPNFSLRLSALAAAVLRPQLELLEGRGEQWRTLYDRVAAALTDVPGLRLPHRLPEAHYVPSSLQFSLEGDAAALGAFREGCAAQGVPLKWFGAPQPVGFTSTYRHWAYAPGAGAPLPRADAVLRGLFDLRLPLYLTPDDAALIGQIIAAAATPAVPH